MTILYRHISIQSWRPAARNGAEDSESQVSRGHNQMHKRYGNE